MSIPRTKELFDLSHTLAAPLLENTEYPHQALPRLSDFILMIGCRLPADEYDNPKEGIYIAKDARIYSNATINGPTIIGHGAEIRPGAFIRGCAIIGDGAVIGNSTEVKGSIIFDKAELPHYNYVGDSIIGFRAHMGAGAIASNLRLDRRSVSIKDEDGSLETGLRKLGAILADHAEIGCGAILNPGTVIGRRTLVYPLCRVGGVIPPDSILKDNGIITKRL